MATKSLQEILGVVPLTTSLRATSSGIPNPFPKELMTVPAKNRILGDVAQYIRTTGERRIPKRTPYGAPARQRSLREMGQNAVKMLHTFDSFNIDPLQLQYLHSKESFTQDRGMDWLKYQLTEAAKFYQNGRIVTMASALRHGALYFDSSYNPLPSSSGADTNLTIEFNVPATHKNQLNGIISASWALANTDIGLQIRNLRQFAVQETGLDLDTALYGVNIPSYISTNDTLQSFWMRNAQLNDEFIRTQEIPNGFLGIKRWIPVYTSFFEDPDGTNQELWADDLVVFMPALSQADEMSWWYAAEGSYPVPKTIDVLPSMESAMSSMGIEYGQFSFGQWTLSPPGAYVYHGDTYLFGPRNEKAIYMADVTP